MTEKADDLAAVRTLVETLQPFENKERERIIRWAQEKLGMLPSSAATSPPLEHGAGQQQSQTATPLVTTPKLRDMKQFVLEKNPQSDIHFAATVAYYYRFEAPEGQRKDDVGSADLQEACRIVSRNRLKSPVHTLTNTFKQGLLDRSERGRFKINAVGENLVAMALPGNGLPVTKPGSKRRRKTSKKATTSRGKR